MKLQSVNSQIEYLEMRLRADQLSFIAAANNELNEIVAGSLSSIRKSLAQEYLTSAGVEEAIAQTEDLIMPVIRNLRENIEFKVSGLEMGDVLQLLSGADGAAIPIEMVENLFNQLAGYAAGSPIAWRHAVAPEQVAVALVVLREVMHHANYRSVSFLPVSG